MFVIYTIGIQLLQFSQNLPTNIFLISIVGAANIRNNPSNISGKYAIMSICGTSTSVAIHEMMNCEAN